MIGFIIMYTKKELAKLKIENIFKYVVEHGDWKLRRGKGLSAILPMPYGIRNPKKAYQVAKEILQDISDTPHRATRWRRRYYDQLNLTGQTPLEAFLGIPDPNQPPWPGARKVPHTCSEWY